MTINLFVNSMKEEGMRSCKFVEIWDDKLKVRITNVGGMKKLLFSPK
jgi:hypothetical protein